MNISLAAEHLFSIGSFPVTNSMLVGWLSAACLIALSFFTTRSLSMIPRGMQNILELVVEFILSLIDSVTHDRRVSVRLFPLIATIFLFVLLVNWFGLLPGVGTVGLLETEHEKTHIVPFIRSTSADLNFTLALALVSVITVQIAGIASIGFFKYASKFLNVTSGLGFFVGILELISEVAKVVSFSFRLFGNIFAGEVLLTVMLVLVPYLIPLPFLAMEVFVGFIQALVFAMLTLVFVNMATVEVHH